MLKQRLIKSNRYGVKCPYSMVAEGITIHNTANDASAKNEADYMERNNNEVSFHIVVDDVEALQLIPFNRNSWHAGDGGSGKGNRKYISLEICYSKSGGSKFTKAEDNAAKVVANLLKEKGWGIEKVKAHRDFSNKNCPHRTNMNNFKNKVKSYLNGSNSNNNASASSSEMYRVRKSWGDVASQKGAFKDKNNAIAECKKHSSYSVFDSKGNSVFTNSTNTFKVGSKVKVIGSKYATGQTVPSWVKSNTYSIKELKSDKALLSDIISWVYLKDLKLV